MEYGGGRSFGLLVLVVDMAGMKSRCLFIDTLEFCKVC